MAFHLPQSEDQSPGPTWPPHLTHLVSSHLIICSLFSAYSDILAISCAYTQTAPSSRRTYSYRNSVTASF